MGVGVGKGAWVEWVKRTSRLPMMNRIAKHTRISCGLRRSGGHRDFQDVTEQMVYLRKWEFWALQV